jgi:hypothetical protein
MRERDMTNRIMQLAGTTTLAAALSFSTAIAAGAQQGDARWQAWVGCWQPAVNGLAAAGSTTLCVSPLRSGAAIEVATIDSGIVKTRDTIDASGTLRTTAARAPNRANGRTTRGASSATSS